LPLGLHIQACPG